MYVYKITDSKTNKVYIGVDTKPKDRLNRWHEHLRLSKKSPTTKFYKQLGKRPNDFSVEVVFESSSVGELFLKEIELISQYDSYKRGYNSTIGGDCFGVVVHSEEHYNELVEIFRDRMKEFNVVKWKDTTLSDRQEMIKHCHTDESNAKRSKTIKAEWDGMTTADKNAKLNGLLTYIENNKDEQRRKAKLASDKAAILNQRKVRIRDRATGEVHEFNSIKEANTTLNTAVRYLEQLKNSGKIGSKKWELLDE